MADGFFRPRRAWGSWRIWRNRTWSSQERGSQREEERSDYHSMENPLKPAIGLHHVADCSRAKPCTQTLERGLTSEKATLCIASVSCGGSPASAYDAYVSKFLPYVFFSGNPYREIQAGDVDPNTKRVRFQPPLMEVPRISTRVKLNQYLNRAFRAGFLYRAGGI